jgi:hypothetical protein
MFIKLMQVLTCIVARPDIHPESLKKSGQ